MESHLSVKTMTMGNYEAWSSDACYGLRIPSRLVDRILALCERSPDLETGGILVGYYTRKRDCAVVTAASAAPSDSQSGRCSFYRGVEDLQGWLTTLWRRARRRYYLGEWHYHPSGRPYPSGVDTAQFRANAEDKSYNCPEPIMVIVGAHPNNHWEVCSFVYVTGRGMLAMTRRWETSDSTL